MCSSFDFINAESDRDTEVRQQFAPPIATKCTTVCENPSANFTSYKFYGHPKWNCTFNCVLEYAGINQIKHSQRHLSSDDEYANVQDEGAAHCLFRNHPGSSEPKNRQTLLHIDAKLSRYA